MAKLNSPFYINMVSPSREEAAVTLALLLTAFYYPDEYLQAMGKSIGLEQPVRPLIDSMGRKMDENWEEMLAKTLEVLEAE